VSDGAVRHVSRLSAPGLLNGADDVVPFFLTDLVAAYDDLCLDDLDEHYRGDGVDIAATISVETQVRLGEHLEPLRSADLLYLALFELCNRHGGAGVFAHMNSNAIKSFERVGLSWLPLAGRDDLRTPTVAPDGAPTFDDDYRPVWIPNSGSNVELLSSLAPFAPPVVTL
jgi:hypothetical protein